MTKNTKITIIGVVACLLIIVLYAAYAFLNPMTNISNLDISADISGNLKFDATGGTSFNLNVDVAQMDAGKVGNVVATADDTMTVTLETDGNEAICCSYDFIWEWDETDNERNQYRLSDGAIEEYVLSGSLSETYLLNGVNGIVNHANPKFKLQVPNYDSQKLANSVYRTSICNNTAELTTKATQTYSLNASFYNLNVAQDHLRGAKLASKIKIDNVVCKKQVTLSDEVLAQVQEKDHSSSQDGTIYKVVQETVEYNGQTLDAGVRYEGQNPDNYVTFNGEEWRIIGVFEGSTIGLQEGKQYTKIIKAYSIDGHAWDVDEENDWESSTLNTYLNGEYLNNISNSNMIANATWYLKGLTSSNYYTPQWYLGERYTGQTGYKDGNQYGAKAEIKAAIGLMYPSDYGYAAYGTECDNKSSMTLYNYETGCSDADWLMPVYEFPYEWFITSSPDYSMMAYAIDGTTGSSVGYETIINEYVAFRPTLYLKNDVVITGGTGSKKDPYTLDYKAPTLSEEVLAQVRDDDYTSSQDGSVYKVTREEVAYNNIMLDAGVRYEGKDPDNYVTFNNEEAGWRIIGTFEGSTIGLESGKQYTKIVRVDNIGNYAWDDDSNDWTTSTLNTYLNSEYFPSLTDSNKIAYAKYNIGILEDPAASTSSVFINERNKTNRGYIGLLSLSDKRFSGYDGTCDNQVAGSCYTGTSQAWANPEWSGWIINASTNNQALTMGTYSPFQDVVTSESWVVYPTLYLEADVFITGGDGSKEMPYTLDYNEPLTLSKTILAKASADDYISSQDQSIYKVSYEEVDYNGKTLDAGVRYEGKDPDNYVTFNGEEAGWRIIGVFEGSTIGLAPTKQYTKIIKATSLGNYAWDSGEENDWENATLNAYLNGEYLNGLSDASKIAKYNNQYSTWYLKALDEATHTGENAYAPQWYLGERYTGYTGYKDGTQYGAKAEIKAAIGLMYPSDYGYAAYGSSCEDERTMTLYNYEGGCAAVDWLAQDSLNVHEEWLMSSDPDTSIFAFYVGGHFGGYVGYDTGLENEFAARPTLYLETDIIITDGNGSKTNPYIIN